MEFQSDLSSSQAWIALSNTYTFDQRFQQPWAQEIPKNDSKHHNRHTNEWCFYGIDASKGWWDMHFLFCFIKSRTEHENKFPNDIFSE